MCRRQMVDDRPNGGTDPDSYENKTVLRNGEAAPGHEDNRESLEH